MLNIAFKSFLLIFLMANEYLAKEFPSVTTNSGKIRGHYLTSYKGNKYEAYQGIPYALPPTGERRFRSPVPIKPWSHELKATNVSQPCPQQMHFSTKISGSEDCLYLNVYVPLRKKHDDKLPVLFSIHGGGFLAGNTPEDEERFIIDSDVIFVSTQYRLGVLGFMSTQDDVVPGNMGLKDQSTALRWTYDNIKYFGGDTRRITLVGSSSGAASVHLHYLSPWSRGLFHAGISLSGTAFAPWALIERSREEAIELGQALNCTDESIRRMVQCLRGKSVDELLSALPKSTVGQNQPIVPFAPVVEKSSIDPFIDDMPSRIISRGEVYDVPWITGDVSEEGLLSTALAANDAALEGVDDNWLKMAPVFLGFYYTIPKDQHRNVSLMIKEHYFKGQPLSMKNFHTFTNVVSDRTFKVSAVNVAVKQASVNRSPVFFYQYSYRATDSNVGAVINSTENLGVCHSDDVSLVLKNSIVDPTKSPRDMAMQRRMIQLWTSVARHGVPSVGTEWRRVRPNQKSFDYLQIDGPDKLAMRSSDDLFEKKFWNSIGFDENNGLKQD